MSIAQNTLNSLGSEYLNIWCRLENGAYWLFRSRPAETALRLVKEYNEQIETGRRYYAFPVGFNAKVLGPNDFALVVLQAIEDQLQQPGDNKYRRIKDEVIGLALTHHGMSEQEILCIDQEITAIYEKNRGGRSNG